MKRLVVYVDVSVIGGLEDAEFDVDSRALWDLFVAGRRVMALSPHTLRELQGAPEAVLAHLGEIPPDNVVMLADSQEAGELAQAYLSRGIVGPGSHADALHIALATVHRADVLVSWNFKHIVNLGRIRLFNAVNMEMGYPMIDIRTPREVLEYD